MNDFSSYIDFNRKFNKKYGWFRTEYPFCFLVIEHELRSFFAGYDENAILNIKRISKYYFPLDALFYLSKFTNTSKRYQFYEQLNSFDEISKRLTETLNTNGYLNFSNSFFLNIKANKFLRKISLSGPQFPKLMRKIVKFGFDAALNDKVLLQKLEKRLSKNYENLLSFLKKQKISFMIGVGDVKPTERFLCKAAKELGIEYFVLAHGYISNPNLISIAPIHATKFITWTKKQADLLRYVAPERTNDIVCFGFPFRLDVNVQELRSRKNLLFVFEPFLGTVREQATFKALSKLATEPHLQNSNLIFRPHPKDRRNTTLKDKVTQIGFQWDQGSLEDSIKMAKCVIGGNTSILTEAAYLGLPAIQIQELATFIFEGAHTIKTDEISTTIKLLDRKKIQKSDEAFDHTSFAQLVLDCIKNSTNRKLKTNSNGRVIH